MQSSVPMQLSIVLPAKNEAAAIGATVEKIHAQLLQMQIVGEIEVLVVNDGSTDDTAAVAQAAGARVVQHPYSKGNGAAIKTGARSALGEVLVFMDADGQHDPADIPRLLDKLNQGYSYVEKEGKAITSVQDVKEGDLLEICVSDGKITARAEKTSAVSWMEQS